MTENKAQHSLPKPPDYISVISASQCARIKITDIEMIEQEGRKLHIITAERDYSFYGSINDVAVSLVDRAFYRALKSMILNFDHVRDISGININFNSGQSLTLGRNSLNRTRKAYKRYLMKYPPYSLWDTANLNMMYLNDNYEKPEGSLLNTLNPSEDKGLSDFGERPEKEIEKN